MEEVHPQKGGGLQSLELWRFLCGLEGVLKMSDLRCVFLRSVKFPACWTLLECSYLHVFGLGHGTHLLAQFPGGWRSSRKSTGSIYRLILSLRSSKNNFGVGAL